MARVKRGVEANRRHKKVLKQAKGYYGARSRVYRVATQAVTKAGQYAYRDRRVKKRTFRRLYSTGTETRHEATNATKVTGTERITTSLRNQHLDPSSERTHLQLKQLQPSYAS